MCECNDGFNGDGTTCLYPTTTTTMTTTTPVAVSLCPSIDCWTYDETTQSCAIKSECATLTCGATAFDVTFKSALFNLDDNQNAVTLAGELISPEWDGTQWTSKVPLGENGMTYDVDADTNE